MATARINPSDATFSLKHVVLRKLMYPLTTTTFTKQQCNQIMAPLLQQGLAHAGVVRSFPRALVHGPLQHGSLDIPHLYTEQTVAHARTILRYSINKSDLTGFLMHMTAEAMRLELGINGELLAAPIILQDHVTNSWIKHVWVSTQECGVTLLTDFADYTPQRVGDVSLMQLFIKSGLKQPKLQAVNNCRMYLQVFLLSDIVSGSGDYILSQFWDHHSPATSPPGMAGYSQTISTCVADLEPSVDSCITPRSTPVTCFATRTVAHTVFLEHRMVLPLKY